MNIIVITTLSLGAIALVAGLVLFAASKKFAVKENPLIDEVEELLPGANCGGCGFAGCRAFAETVVNKKDMSLNCPVAGADTMAQIAAKLGLEVDVSVKKIARVKCQGGTHAKHIGEYLGIRTCEAAVVGAISDLVCPHGCFGYGDCARACPFDCIEIIDGVAVVDEDRCTACGICIKVCPRNLIELMHHDKKVYVACMSPDKGADVKQYCSVGCIGCKLCDKACQFEAIDYKPFISKVIPDNCTQCMACVIKCPTNSILVKHAGLVQKPEPKEVSSSHENVHI